VAGRRPKTPERILSNTERLGALIAVLELDERGTALAGVALTLAAFLDEGAGMATAAVARELRATVEALTDDGGDAADDALEGMSTPIRDSPKSRKGNART
jgi:hypothetical protein